MEQISYGPHGGKIITRHCDFCEKSISVWEKKGRGGDVPIDGQPYGRRMIYHWPDKDVCLDCLGQYDLYRSQTGCDFATSA